MPNEPEVPQQKSTLAESVAPAIPKRNNTFMLSMSVVLGAGIIAAAYIFVHTQPPSQIAIDTSKDMERNEPISAPTPIFPISTKEEPVDEGNSKTFFHSVHPDFHDYSSYYSDTIKQQSVSWHKTPKELGDLGILQSANENTSTWFYAQPLQYIEIGTYKDGHILYVQLPCDGLCFSNDFMILYGSQKSGYFIVTAYSTYLPTNDYYEILSKSNILTDDTLRFDTIPTETLNLNGAVFSVGTPSEFFSNTAFNNDTPDLIYRTELVAITKYGPVFRGYRSLWGGLTEDIDYALRLENGLRVPLEYKLPFMSDDRVPQIQWPDGTTNTESYRTDGLNGCGMGGPEVYMSVNTSDIALAGYTSSQEKIYTVINPQHPLIERVYDGKDIREYYQYDRTSGETITHEISRADFIEKKSVLLFQDPFGLYHVLTNTTYGPQAECAKPVIYLYPEKTTDISVALDALITKSEPHYENGWQVTAHPDGSLLVNGQSYSSLFWDGYGNGYYPLLHEGFVVKTEDALPLMSEHLKIMGFNQTEIKDFVTFWSPYMPTEPYTRFSWIGTRGMEELAKLQITPNPDTLIRAFVDYEGLSLPIELTEQKIPSYERSGYVVTEWGGLMRE